MPWEWGVLGRVGEFFQSRVKIERGDVALNGEGNSAPLKRALRAVGGVHYGRRIRFGKSMSLPEGRWCAAGMIFRVGMRLARWDRGVF